MSIVIYIAVMAVVNAGMFASLGTVSYGEIYIATAISAVIGTAIAVILAYRNLPLIVVALAASASALVTDFLCSII